MSHEFILNIAHVSLVHTITTGLIADPIFISFFLLYINEWMLLLAYMKQANIHISSFYSTKLFNEISFSFSFSWNKFTFLFHLHILYSVKKEILFAKPNELKKTLLNISNVWWIAFFIPLSLPQLVLFPSFALPYKFFVKRQKIHI